MRYDPKDVNNCLPAGTYEASIESVSETDDSGMPLRSRKSGEDMQRVVFTVYSDRGERRLTQYFTARSMLWMYGKLAKALGKDADFKAGTFCASHHIGANLQLTIEVEESDEYGDQNRIKAFSPTALVRTAKAPTTVAAKKPAKPAPAPQSAPTTEDEPPF